MFAWTPRTTGHVALGDPSPLLTHIAGEFAAQIAGLWPAPHAVFLTADAPRRHLLCLRLAAGGEGPLQSVVETILHGAFRTAVAAAIRPAPAGLKRALDHMGEVAWPRGAYLQLLALLTHPQAAKVLRHASVLEADQIIALSALPLAMLEAGGGKLGFSLHQARLAAEIHQGLILRDGDEAARAACRRWGAASSVKDALDLMGEDLVPAMPPPPFIGTARLRPLRSHAEMRDAALRYRNCLRNYIHNASRGSLAIYEWLGEPRAVVEIRRDEVFGWRLSQARMADNIAVPAPTRAAICAELRGMGVHVGRADWQLRNALDEASQPRFLLEPADVLLDYVFADAD